MDNLEKTVKKAVSGLMAGVLLVSANALPASAITSALNGKHVEVTASDDTPLVIYEGAHLNAHELFSLTQDETLTLSEVEEKYREVTYTDKTSGETITGYILESELAQYTSTSQQEVKVAPTPTNPLELMINGSSIGDNLIKLTEQTALTVLSSEGHMTTVNYTNTNGETVEALVETGALKNALIEENETSAITVTIPEGQSLSFWEEARTDAFLMFELFTDATLTLGEEVQYVKVQYNDVIEVETETTIETTSEEEGVEETTEAPVTQTFALEETDAIVQSEEEEAVIDEEIQTSENETQTEEDLTTEETLEEELIEDVETTEEITNSEETVIQETITTTEESIIEYEGYIVYGDFINAVTDEVAEALELGNGIYAKAIKGIVPKPTVLDISHWQLPKDMDYDLIASQIELVIIRVQSGDTIDNHYQTHIEEFQKRGIPVHVYAYFRGEDVEDAKKEAEAFYQKANPYNVDMYWVDVEEQTASNMREVVSAFTKELRSLVGSNVKVGAYIANHMYTQFNLDVSEFDALWIPTYGVNDGTYSGSDPWHATDLHQYTDKGRLAGFSYDLDLSRVTGTHGKDISFFTSRPSAEINLEDYHTTNPGTLRLTSKVNIYNSVEFNEATQTKKSLLSGSVVEVKGIHYSKAGTPRLKIDGGYISANKSFSRADSGYFIKNPGTITLSSKLNIYNSVEFSNKTKTNQAYASGVTLKISGIEYSKAGTPRLKVGNGYISANETFSYIYYTKNPQMVYLTSNVNVYNSVEFNNNTKTSQSYKKGSTIQVTGIDYSKAGTPRLKVNGGYISSNAEFSQKFISQNPGTVKLAKKANVYRNAEFTDENKTSQSYAKGSSVKVTGIAYSKAGTPRLQVAGGYISANAEFFQ